MKGDGGDIVFSVPPDGTFYNKKVTLPESMVEYGKMFGSYGITFPVTLDENTVIARYYGVRAIPYFILVDQRGVIRAAWMGWYDTTEAYIRKRVKALLDDSKMVGLM